MQRHPRRNDTEKQNLLKDWEQSKENMPAFCKASNISVSALKCWQSKFRVGGKPKVSSDNFIAMEVGVPSAADMHTPYAELLFDNGARLLLHHPVTSAFRMPPSKCILLT